MNNTISHHYDLLIDENNAPVYDPKPLKDYMDKWDGTKFIDKMNINKEKSVLEIGVGTGRLAIRVVPLCRRFCGFDISSKTIERAKENLSAYKNVELICNDFLVADFEHEFDIIYSSLTFMHIKDKQRAFDKVREILSATGKFVLSIDKSQSNYIDMNTRKIRIYPDSVYKTVEYIQNAKLKIEEQYETEFAYIFVCTKMYE